jgi:hypothetical protein
VWLACRRGKEQNRPCGQITAFPFQAEPCRHLQAPATLRAATRTARDSLSPGPLAQPTPRRPGAWVEAPSPMQGF